MTRKVLLAILCCVVVITPAVHAETGQSSFLTDDQLAQIRANCQTSQSILGRVHANDGLMRVNLGQQFDVITTKLMAPMNSRIALNKLDGVALAQTTVDYNEQLDGFRAAYQQYEKQVSNALAVDCQTQPAAFYTTIIVARQYRQAVHDSLSRLQALVQQYRDQLMMLRENLPPVGDQSS